MAFRFSDGNFGSSLEVDRHGLARSDVVGKVRHIARAVGVLDGRDPVGAAVPCVAAAGLVPSIGSGKADLS